VTWVEPERSARSAAAQKERPLRRETGGAPAPYAAGRAGFALTERGRRYTRQAVVPTTTRALHAVPLPLRAAQALEELPPRLDTRLLFPGRRGGHLNLHEWRFRCLDAGRQSRGPRAPLALRASAHLRHVCDRRRCLAVRARPLHGHERRADRPHLRPPATRLARAEVGSSRLVCVRSASSGEGAGWPLREPKGRLSGTFRKSGRPDLNRGPLVPQTSALTRLRHAPSDLHFIATRV
jgi:hypothetical protein